MERQETENSEEPDNITPAIKYWYAPLLAAGHLIFIMDVLVVLLKDDAGFPNDQNNTERL